MSCASSSFLKEKEKEKEIQKKRNIKSRKIDKRKRKMLVSKAFHNNGCFDIGAQKQYNKNPNNQPIILYPLSRQ